MLTTGTIVSKSIIYKPSKFGAMLESLVIKWPRSSLDSHMQPNSFNVVPLPLFSSLSRKTPLRDTQRISSNGRGDEVGEFRIESITAEPASNVFRRGRTPAGRTRGSSIWTFTSERTSMVGCETRKAPSSASAEIKVRPSRVSSRRDTQDALDKRGVAFTVRACGFVRITY